MCSGSGRVISDSWDWNFFHRPQIIGLGELGHFGVLEKRQIGPW